MRNNFLLFAFILISNGTFCQIRADSNRLKEKLIAAYPNFIKNIDNNYVIFKDGTRMVYDDGKIKTPAQKIADADIEDQVNAAYIKGKTENPGVFSEPGRTRNDTFFKKMYGANAKVVIANLVEIDWLPGTVKKKILVSAINGIDKKMQAISTELEKNPACIAFVNKPGGTFNWRVIKGTNRSSTHSFGIAIDINTQYSNYWQWDNKTTGETKKITHYTNRIPIEIVEIFEKYGFIRGGKWYHYDTMHFEYRPELL